MKQINCRSLVLGAALATLLGASGTAYAIGEQACEAEITGMFRGTSMADVVATRSVPMRNGGLRVDWSVNTENETARGFCKVTKGGDVVRVKTLYHKTYKKNNANDFDGFYYDEHLGQWRDDSGQICHTCTPDNGFPGHGSVGGNHGGHQRGDIYWDYDRHRPCPNGYVNCDAHGACGRRGDASRCR